MELYRREAVKLVRETDARFSVLSDKALVELWGMYSCETVNQFWVACDHDEVQRFVVWAQENRFASGAIYQAQRQGCYRPNVSERLRRAPNAKRYVQVWDHHRVPDTRLRSGAGRSAARPGMDKPRTGFQVPLITVHELIRSINAWCLEEGIKPTAPGSSVLVNERMIRDFCGQGLLDPPGSPEDGRRRGFSEKHASQLRAIRLLQARSLPLKDINGYLFGLTLERLREIEREELALLKGTFLPGTSGWTERRSGEPRWA